MSSDRLRHRVVGRLRRSLRAPADRDRLASFPFLSGDTYRSMCHVVIESEADYAAAIAGPGVRGLVFCPVDIVAWLLEQLSDADAAATRLVIHNGDLVPSDLLLAHAHRFERVFAVNWLGERALVEPLPIGLENAWLGVNGDLSRFQDCVPARRGDLLRRQRSREVLLAFNDSTCVTVRSEARSAFIGSRLDVDAPQFMNPAEYHTRLRDTLFVPSPRGNGADCHRTWEAIYAGAVPIVLNSDWAFEHMDLPVLAVSNWADAVSMIGSDPRDVYQTIIAGATGDAFAMRFLGNAGMCGAPEVR